MVDNFLPVFDMAHEKEIKKDLDIDGQIERIKNDISNRREYIFDKKPFTDVENIEEILETTMTEKYQKLPLPSAGTQKPYRKTYPAQLARSSTSIIP